MDEAPPDFEQPGDRMKRKKVTVIAVEMDQTMIVRGQGAQIRAYCAVCAAQVPTVTLNEAAALAFTEVNAVNRWVAEKRIHFAGTETGGLRLCLPALLVRVSDILRQQSSGCASRRTK